MAAPEYSAEYSRPAIYRGDTLRSMTLLVETDDSPAVPIVPTAICAQLRDQRGRLAYTFETQIDQITGVVTIDAVDGDVKDPGTNPDVITDGMILSAVQTVL